MLVSFSWGSVMRLSMRWLAFLLCTALPAATLAEDAAFLRYEGADRAERSLAAARRPHRGWIATYLSFWVQAYNTHVVRKDELPRRYQDLLDARWKGKLGIEARVPDWYAALVTDMGEEKGIRFFRELVAKNGIS